MGDALKLERDVEVLLVGGAAALLTGLLPDSWVTQDVDVIHWRPAADRDAVLAAAEEVARKLNLPPSWMSEDVGLFAWTLPPGWETRRVHVVTRGPLKVFAAGRLDLISMKFVAHRAVDLKHLELLEVTEEELNAVLDIMQLLEDRSPDEHSRIEMARAYIREWKMHA